MSHRIEGRAFVDGALQPARIVCEGKQIVGVETIVTAAADLPIVLPGFIDLHVHGAAGSDFMDGSPQAFAAVTRHHARNGTCALAATTLSASSENIERAILAATHFRPDADCAEIVAVHLEGPYVNPRRSGAQDPGSIRTPDIAELSGWVERAGSLPLIMTIAPELDGASAIIERFRDRIQFSIGHTDASYSDTVNAIERGATRFTHLFNAMPGLHHRDPGPIAAAAVHTSVTVELIADGVHLHPAILRIAADMFRTRATLVTDSMRACGMIDGSYRLYSYDVTVRDGEARLADGTLAGSVLTMAGAVRNMVELAGVPLELVVPMATEIPARILGIQDRKGKLREGFDADIVVLSSKMEIDRILLRGAEVRLS